MQLVKHRVKATNLHPSDGNFWTMQKCDDEEWEQLPKTKLTSEQEWKPTCLDGGIEDIEQWAESFKTIKQDEQWDVEKSPF